MQQYQSIKILVVDGHKVVANAIAGILDIMTDMEVLGSAESGDEMFRALETFVPDIVLIDIDLPGAISGLEVLRQIHCRSPQTRIMVLTNLLNQAIIHDALRTGVTSYLLKYSSTDELISAIRLAHNRVPTLSPEVTQMLIQDLSMPNGFRLTAREQEVLRLLSQGLNNHKIAERLSISFSTVQFHVSNILNKLGVHNRIEAATFAVRHKLAA